MQAAAQLPNPPVVIFVSSLAAAGPAVDGQPREPHHIPKPVSSYGKSKLAGEILASQLSDRVPLTILRPPIVIGEGDQLTLDLFHSVATFRFHLVPGWTPAKVSIIHAADLVQALILAAERGKRVTPAATAMLSSGYKILPDGAIVPRVPPPDLITQQEVAPNAGQGIYFPADEAMPDFAEFGQLMARGLGRKRVRCVHTPHAGAFVLGAISEFVGKIIRKPMAMNLDKAREAVAGNWICSPRTAFEDLGFHPGASLDERFRQTVRWYCDEGWI
jgi:nucleoside-diphosphate-sugar epimerase